jgi:hypothetical protein
VYTDWTNKEAISFKVVAILGRERAVSTLTKSLDFIDPNFVSNSAGPHVS